MRRRRARAGDHGQRDAGLSAVSVLFTFLALTALVMVTSVYASNAVRPAARHLHWAQAGAAAEAGAADYEQRLLADPTSWLDVDCGDPAQVGQDPGVLPHACPWPAGETGWAPVADGDDPATSPAYHYEVTTAPAELDDLWASSLTLTVTGRAGSVERVLEVRFARESTADYALHQETDLVEPTTWAEGRRALGQATDLPDGCGAGAVLRAADRTDECPNVGVLAPGDSITGAVLTQDRLVLGAEAGPGADAALVDGEYATADQRCGPEDDDTGSWAGCVGTDAGGDAAAGRVDELLGGWAPVRRSWSGLPHGIATLYADVPGCHYYGATRIVGEGKSMRVWSPGTAAAAARGATVAVPGPDGVLPTCGTGSVGVPDGLAVVVWTTPLEYATAAGSWAVDTPLDTVDQQVGGDDRYGRLPIGAYGSTPDPALAPGGDWLTGAVDPEQTRTTKWARYGNLYVEGQFSPGADDGGGGVTFVAQESVVVTGDVLRTGAGPGDACGEVGTECLLGVVAGRDVEVMHPVLADLAGEGTDAADARWDFGLTIGEAPVRAPADDTESRVGSWFDSWPHRYSDQATGAPHPDPAAGPGVQVQAVVQALSGTLRVQHHGGAAGAFDVVVHGSLAQRYAGALGPAAATGDGAGYPTIVHDPALASAVPPYLAPLLGTAWQVRAVSELRAG
ncbi:hypothetical protein [Cellulomonas pakistanensis]|uniref:Uncharacterized protein n=1 Tax=Cellulomonas pakistanensis TaxID=992287 RepID=A0A919PE10_9CELL|nr:hypothetical protein [Cellulomonas pakistanensis]GIG36862.1 hypothetical protein Cpa01nite_22430 [Cellulomonas pakistanensis]